MPIAIQGLYKCQKCGYKEYRYVSDGNAIKALKPCPKCYSSMRKMDDLEKDPLDVVRERVGRFLAGRLINKLKKRDNNVFKQT